MELKFRSLKVPKWILVTLVLLVVIRACLPVIGLYGINYALENKLGVYKGHIKDFDLSLYRGAYQLQELTIKKRGEGEKATPLLRIKEIDLSISWKALFKKILALDVRLDTPSVFLADAGSEENSQLGTEEPTSNWRSALDVIIPVSLQSLVINNGSIRFVNRDLKAPLPMEIDQLQLRVSQLYTHNTDKLSPFALSARLQKQATAEMDGMVNILSDQLRWGLNYKFENFQMSSINQVLRVYLPLDITHSTLSLYGEAEQDQGHVKGYAKVFLKDNDVIAHQQKLLSLKHFFYEVVIGFSSWFLENSEKDDVAFILPFEMKNGEFDIDGSKAFWSAVENKSDALKPGIDNKMKP